jgi:hypothetical protein
MPVWESSRERWRDGAGCFRTSGISAPSVVARAAAVLLIGLIPIYSTESTSCVICEKSDCCTASVQGLSAECKSEKNISYSVAAVPGRPVWLTAQATDGTSVGSTLVQGDGGSWRQVFEASAYFVFTEDLLFVYSTDQKTMCSRRWGCMPCYAGEPGAYCGTGWVNMTIQFQGSECGNDPLANIFWWGEGSGHGQGLVRTCLSQIPDQVQPQPPVPPNNTTRGASFVLRGSWPSSQWSVTCHPAKLQLGKR